MPDTKITALTALTAADPANDVLPIVDVSDTTMAASGTTKKISVNNILGAGGTATLASATITGDLTVDTSTFYVSSSTDKVGIGTTSLSGEKLTVAGNVSANAWIGRTNISAPTADVAIYRAADNTFAISTANTERLRVDVSGNLGLGVTPSAWSGGGNISLKNDCSISTAAADFNLGANYYYNAGWKFVGTGYATQYYQTGGQHRWYASTTSGTAGNAITFTQAMTLDASGNLLVGTPSVLGGAAGRGNITINGSVDALLAFGNASSLTGYIAQSTSGMDIVGVGATFVRIQTNGSSRLLIDSAGNTIPTITATPPTLGIDSQMVFNLTSNTNLRISVRGTDGVTRTANITLA